MRKIMAYMCAAAALSAYLVASPAASATAATGSSAGRSVITAPAVRPSGFHCYVNRGASYTHCWTVQLVPGDLLALQLTRQSSVTPVDVSVVFTYVGTNQRVTERRRATFQPNSGFWVLGRNNTSRRMWAYIWAKPSHPTDSGTLHGTIYLYP